MKLTTTKVAQRLGVSTQTLLNWYGWYLNPDIVKSDNIPELPMYEVMDSRGTRGWSQEDIPRLEKFRDWVPKGRAGIMGDYNAQYWGKRGVRAIQNKKSKPLKSGK